jgi:hypothetical protein
VWVGWGQGDLAVDKPGVERVAADGATSVTASGAVTPVAFDYDAVTEPFSYANGYHRLLMMVQQR